jgi:hypothetical protein
MICLPANRIECRGKGVWHEEKVEEMTASLSRGGFLTRRRSSSTGSVNRQVGAGLGLSGAVGGRHDLDIGNL